MIHAAACVATPLLISHIMAKSTFFSFPTSSISEVKLAFGLLLLVTLQPVFTFAFPFVHLHGLELHIALRPHGSSFFSAKETCSTSAKRCVANWLTVMSVGLVSTPREFRAKLTRN